MKKPIILKKKIEIANRARRLQMFIKTEFHESQCYFRGTLSIDGFAPVRIMVQKYSRNPNVVDYVDIKWADSNKALSRKELHELDLLINTLECK